MSLPNSGKLKPLGRYQARRNRQTVEGQYIQVEWPIPMRGTVYLYVGPDPALDNLQHIARSAQYAAEIYRRGELIAVDKSTLVLIGRVRRRGRRHRMRMPEVAYEID